MPESFLSPAAQALFSASNVRDARERNIRVQMASLTPQMYQNFQQITAQHSGISADLAMSMVRQGLTADTPGISKIVSADGISQLKRDQMNIDKIKSTVDKDRGLLGAISNFYQKKIYDPFKGGTRVLFAALRYPYDLTTTLTRDIFAFDEPEGSQGKQFLKDLATFGGTNTQLGALIADRLGGKPGVQTGTGFFINPNSRVGKAQARAMSSYGTIEGESFTIGRNIFRAMADNPDKTGYKIASGIVDATLNVLLDPTTFLGFGAANKVIRGGKAAVEATAKAAPADPATASKILLTTAEKKVKRLNKGIGRDHKKIATLEAKTAQQAEVYLSNTLEIQEQAVKGLSDDPAALATLSLPSLARWLTTNPKVQTGEMLRGLDALTADQSTLRGIGDAGIFMDELPESGKVSVGVMRGEDEMFVTGVAGKELNVLDLSDNLTGKTAKELQEEQSKRLMLIELLNDYSRNPEFSTELRTAFAGVADEIRIDGMTLKGMQWAKPQLPIEGEVSKNTLGWMLSQIQKTKNPEAMTMLVNDIRKIWDVDAFTNVRSVMGSRGGVVVFNGSKVAATGAKIGFALSDLSAPTNLGSNLAKLAEGAGDTEKQLAKVRKNIEEKKAQKTKLQQQIKDINLYNELLATDKDAIARLASEDEGFQNISNIIELKPDVSGTRDLLREQYLAEIGVTDFIGGGISEVPRFREALKYLLGRNFHKVAEVVAKEKDVARIHKLFGTKLDIDMANDLAAATNADDVMRVFLRNLGSPETDPQIFKSLALRGQIARMNPSPVARLVQPLSLAPLKELERFDRVYTRFFVRKTVLNLNDKTNLVNGMADWISSAQFKTVLGKATQESLIDDVVRGIAKADTEQARAAVINNALVKAMSDVAKKYNLDEDATKGLLDLVKLQGKEKTEPGMTLYTVGRILDGGDPEIVYSGREKVRIAKGISMFQVLKGSVFLPDTKEILRSFNELRLNKPLYGAKATKVFLESAGDTWRTAQLAFRASYVLRNIGEMQMRQLLSGHTNIISNPLQFIAMVMANSGRTNAFTRRMAKYRFDLADNAFANLDAEGEFLDAIRGYQIQAFRAGSVSDYRTNQASEIFKFYRAIEANPQMSSKTKKEFYKALAFTINRFAADPINAKVARLMALENEEAKLAFVKSLIDDFDKPGSYLKEYADGVFVEPDNLGLLRSFFDELPEGLSDNLSPEFFREKVQEFIRKDNVSAEKVFTFLFDETQPHTIAGQIRAIQGQGPQGQRLFNIIADEDPIKAPWATKVSTYREHAALESSFAKQLEDTFSLEDIRGSRALAERKRIGESQGRKEINLMVDWFFEQATKLESKFNFGPEYQMAYWDHVARYASMLTDKDLLYVRGKAVKSLAPLRIGGKVVKDEKGNEFIEGGKLLPKKHPALRAIDSELKKRQKGKASPPAGGGASWTTVHQMAAKNASGYVKNLFYDASRQKQWAQAMRLVVPFAQAHTNTLTKWGQLGVRNPRPAYRFFKAFDALTKQGTNVIYDATGMTYDDTQGFLYSQEGRDGKQFKIPLAGNFLGALAGRNLSMGNALQITAPVESLNLAWGQVNPLVPGFGPAMQAIFIGSGRADEWGAGYQIMRDIITPFGRADSVEDIIFPAWFRKSALFWLNNTAEVQRRTKDWAAYLASTGEYGDNPLANDAARTKLFEDAQNLSRNLGFVMGLFQNISPATPSAEILAKIKNPDNKMKFMTLSILWEHWSRILDANPGDYQTAVKLFADTYGKNNLMVLLGTSTNAVRGTDDAWTFLNNNPEAAAKYARNPGDIVPFFFPGGEASVKYYNWQRQTGARRPLSNQDLAQEAEGLVYSMMKGQLVEEQIANGYPQFWLVAQIEQLDKEFGARPPDMITSGTAQERVARVGLALEDPAFKDSPIYDETLAFYTKYSEFDKLLNELKVSNYAQISAKGGYATLLRNNLVSMAERLMTDNPTFSRMYYGVFSGLLEG